MEKLHLVNDRDRQRKKRKVDQRKRDLALQVFFIEIKRRLTQMDKRLFNPELKEITKRIKQLEEKYPELKDI